MPTDLAAFVRSEPLVRVLPIIVLYRCPLSQSSTYNTMLSAGAALNDVAVYDNSPSPQVDMHSRLQLLAYRHDSANGGLTAAYNWAAQVAEAKDYAWLVLLDQDSRLPAGFFSELQALATVCGDDDEVAAVVPRVRCGGNFVSPKAVRFGRLAPLPEAAVGAWPHELMAINAGTAVKVKFVNRIGGFHPGYWLDYLDHWLFRTIYREGKKAVISRSVLDHDLSVHNCGSVEADRYRNILAAEASFMTFHKPPLESIPYVLRLMARAVKQAVISQRLDLASQTAAMLMDYGKKSCWPGDRNPR